MKMSRIAGIGMALAVAVSAWGGTIEPIRAAESEDYIEFDHILLAENDIAKVELVNFYQEDRNWSEGAQNEKFFTVKLTNKSEDNLFMNSGQFYLNDEECYVVMVSGTMNPEAGRAGNYDFMVAYDTTPEHTALDSMEDLYGVDGYFDGWTEDADGNYKEDVRLDFNLADALETVNDENMAGTEAETGTETALDAAGQSVLSTDYISIDGIYVDDSYTCSTGDSYRCLYVVYTATTPAENLKIDCKSMTLTFNGVNSYTAVRSRKQVRYMPDCYSSAYLKTVSYGESARFVEMFEIPEAEFEAGRTITFTKSQIPDCDQLLAMTDEIIHCDSPEAVGQAADPEGCEKEVWALQDADDATKQAVMAEINGYQWEVNGDIYYEIEFWDPDQFEIRSAISTVDGTYQIKNGYIICTNNTNGAVSAEIPFTIDNGVVDVDMITPFDSMK